MAYIIKEVTKENLTDEMLDELVLLLRQLSTSVTKSFVQDAVASSQSVILCALNETNVIIGTTTMAYLYCMTGIRVHIEDVVVDSVYRGQGIAQLLIQEGINRATKLKAKSIDLTSRPEREAANKLYKKLGFVQRDTNVYRFVA